MAANKSVIELEFSIGHCNGTMRMQIFVNDQLTANYNQFETNNFIVKQEIPWPSTVKLVLSNKNLSHDTTVDTDGKIIADKFIQLKKILVDRVESTVDYINSLLLDTGDKKINSSYWGFNGTVELNFNQNDSFLWHLKQRATQNKCYAMTYSKNKI